NEVGVCDAEQHLMEFRPLAHGRGAEIGAAVAFEIQGQVYIPLTNFTGHVQVLLNSKGEPVDIYRYTAFGEETIFDPSGDVKKPITPWRFCSKRTDPETHLINFGRRYYNVELSRWLTTDPAGFTDGMNLYSYVKNNPFRYIDPDGRFAFALPLICISLGEFGISFITAEVVVASLTGAVLAWGVYELDKTLNKEQDVAYYHEAISDPSENEKKKGDRKSPYGGDELGDDPTKCPGEEYTWKGDGPPGSGEGAWYNGKTKESLYPDLNHPLPKGPHWDYRDRKTEYEERLFLDGTWEPKK
ncbi:RHS repeat-associated core domain-containing protein, partial [Parachlamydia acanthamoebae]